MSQNGELHRVADRHPVIAMFVVWVVGSTALIVWDLSSHGALLLGKAAPEKRVELYGQIGATAVALLAAALTVLAILIALPDRPRAQELKDTDGWRLLLGSLVGASFFCLVTVVLAHVGVAIDDAEGRPREWLEQLVFTSAATAFFAVVLSGVAFALLLRALRRPADPSRGRGEARP